MPRDQAAKHELHARGQSFFIQVKFRRNNCWHGTIQWLEGRKTLSFRSMLELMLLMHEALEKADSGEEKPRSWEDAEAANANSSAR